MDRMFTRASKLLLAAVLVLTFVLSPLASENAYAAMSARIAFSDPSADLGSEFTVNMKISSLSGESLGSAKVMLSYDPAYLEFISGDNAEGGAGSISVRGLNQAGATVWPYTLKFKALQAGSTSITVSDWEISDKNAKAASLDKKGSASVTIKGDAGASINANLTSLKISPGVLTPEFTADNTEYTALVGEDVEKIAVSAPTADSNAKVVISGNSGLEMGDNEVLCKVTAQDGTTTKTYRIVVTKKAGIETPVEGAAGADASAVTANVNGVDYSVAASFDESIIPEGFVLTDIVYSGKQIKAVKAEDRDLTLAYLISADGAGDFFVYDEASGIWSPYATLNVSPKSITIVPMGAGVVIPEGFAETTLELNGKKVTGWVWATDSEQKYCVVYGMNQDGNKDFYRYDMAERTIQRYFKDPDLGGKVPEDQYYELAEKYNELTSDFQQRGYIMLGLAAVSIILLLALIILFIVNGRRSAEIDRLTGMEEDRKDRAEKKDRSDREDKAKKARKQERESKPEKPAARRRRSYDEYEDEDFEAEEFEEPAERKPRRKAAPEVMSEREKYLRGEETAEEIYHHDEPAPTQMYSDEAEKEIFESLARDVHMTTAAPDDDDFEDIEL